MKIENNQLLPQYLKFKNEYLKKVEEVLDSGWYVLGNEVKCLKKNLLNIINLNIVLVWPVGLMLCFGF